MNIRPAAVVFAAIFTTMVLMSACSSRDVTTATENACATSDNALVIPGAASRMRQIIDAHLKSFPGFAGLAGHPNAMAKAFVAGRAAGYMAELAITGPDRAAEDAYARSLNYPIRELPLYPLSGVVVADNPETLLELYQTNSVFNGTAAASEWLDSIAESARLTPKGTPGAATQVDFHLGPSTVAFHRFNGPDDGQHESTYEVAARVDRTVVQLSIQGGPSFSEARAQALARSAIQATENACDIKGEVR